MEGVSHAGAGTCLFLLAGLGIHLQCFYFSLFLMFLAGFCHGFEVVGSGLNPTDLAPPYSGSLYGVMNTISAIPGLCQYLNGHAQSVVMVTML